MISYEEARRSVFKEAQILGAEDVALDDSFRRVLAAGEAREGSEVLLFLRPEDVLLARRKFESSIRNWFEGRVVEVSPGDRLVLVSLDCGFLLKARLTRVAVDELGLRVGETAWAGIKAASLRALPAGVENGD